MLDYIEQTSLKFHIDRFLNYNENEIYLFHEYEITFQQNQSCFYLYIVNTSLPTNKNQMTFVIEKESYNFELFLTIFQYTEITFKELINEKQ